jgi:magnesium chelatase family protein
MVNRSYSLITQGLKPILVSVEVVATRGKPIFILIGLADRAMTEARERITAVFS